MTSLRLGWETIPQREEIKKRMSDRPELLRRVLVMNRKGHWYIQLMLWETRKHMTKESIHDSAVMCPQILSWYSYIGGWKQVVGSLRVGTWWHSKIFRTIKQANRNAVLIECHLLLLTAPVPSNHHSAFCLCGVDHTRDCFSATPQCDLLWWYYILMWSDPPSPAKGSCVKYLVPSWWQSCGMFLTLK